MNTLENPSPWPAELIFKPGVHFSVVEQPVILAPIICVFCLVEFVASACPVCGLHMDTNDFFTDLFLVDEQEKFA